MDGHLQLSCSQVFQRLFGATGIPDHGDLYTGLRVNYILRNCLEPQIQTIPQVNKSGWDHVLPSLPN